MIDFRSTNPQVDPNNVARRDRYRYFRQLFKGRHLGALQILIGRVPEDKRKLVYVAVNLAGLISRKCADFLFGEAPVFKGAAEADKEPLASLIKALNLETALYEAALTQSYAGDLVLRLRVDDGQLVLEEIPAGNYYVNASPCNARDIDGQAVAFEVKKGDNKFLRVEHHEPGLIIHEAFALNTEGKISGSVPLSVTDGDDAPPTAEEETGVDRPLLWLVRNLCLGDEYWSLGDYEDIFGLFEALNNRLSQIDRILGRHSNPKLTVPQGTTGGDLDSNNDLFVVENVEQAKALGYVTWDGQLDAAFRQLEALINYILWLAEMSPALLGLDKSGAPDSGKALRLRFLATEHKINRKKRYFDPEIKSILLTASQLGQHFGVEGIRALSGEPTITWQDGLPKIFSELAADLTNLHAESLVSTKTAVMMLFDKTEEEADAEIALISKEKEAAAALTLDAFQNSGGNSQNDAPPGPQANDQRNSGGP
jgi:hypothetical protein